MKKTANYDGFIFPLTDAPDTSQRWAKLAETLKDTEDVSKLFLSGFQKVGIETKDDFCKLWKDEETPEGRALYPEFPFNDYFVAIAEAKKHETTGGLIFTSLCMFYEFGEEFPFAEYVLQEYRRTGDTGDVLRLDTEDARKWLIMRKVWGMANKVVSHIADGVCSPEIEKALQSTETKPRERKPRRRKTETPKPEEQKGESVTPLENQETPPDPSENTTNGDAPKAEAVDVVEIVETEEIAPNNAVSNDFFEMLDVTKASEETKAIALYIASKWRDGMRKFAEEFPEYNRATKDAEIKKGFWDIPEDVAPPLVFTPQQMAKDFYPHDYKKEGQRKTAKRALMAFAPLQNATICRKVEDTQTGQIVERVTPIFTIEYDFKEGTPDDVKARIIQNTADPEAVDVVQNIRVFATIPMIANQFTNVADVDTIRREMLNEKSDAIRMIARRLLPLNVPVIGLDRLITAEEMPARWIDRPKEREKGVKKACEHAEALSGKKWNYKEDARKLTRVGREKQTPKPEDKPKTEATTKTRKTEATTRRPANRTKGRGRPKKE